MTSRGLRGLRDYLAEYAASERFTSLAAETQALKDALARDPLRGPDPGAAGHGQPLRG